MADVTLKVTKKDSSVKSIDDAFAKIEEQIEAMKGEDVSLEEAFDCFQKGMKLVGFAEASIDKVEKQVKKILNNGEEEDFE